MPNKVFLATVAADVLFLVAGCLELGFALFLQNEKDKTATNGEDALKYLLYDDFPLTAGMVNGGFIIAAFVLTLPGLLLPMRGWLKIAGYLVTFCALFTLCLGVFLWIMTLRIRKAFFDIYVAQEAGTQSLIQQTFDCCGYEDSQTPAFIFDNTCPSPVAASLLRGCATSIASFANGFVDRIFTAMFGVVGISVLLILCIACLLKDRKERERYRYIDQKNGYGKF